MDFFLKFQGYAKYGKNCQEEIEEIKDSVEGIGMLQNNHVEALMEIPEIYL